MKLKKKITRVCLVREEKQLRVKIETLITKQKNEKKNTYHRIIYMEEQI